MAQVNVINGVTSHKVEKTVEVSKPESIQLDLSIEEAIILKSIVGSVIGLNKVRDITSSIWAALSVVGGVSGAYNGGTINSFDFDIKRIQELTSKFITDRTQYRE